MRLGVALVFVVLATACASASRAPEAAVATTPRNAWLVGAQGTAIGRVRFSETTEGVVIRLEIPPGLLTPAWYAVNLTDHGDCSDFSNGFNRSGATIGAASDSSSQPPSGIGELPPFEAPEGGPIVGELRAPRFTLASRRAGDRWPLLDRDGSALVLQTGTEQFGPSGGTRVACAALTRLP